MPYKERNAFYKLFSASVSMTALMLISLNIQKSSIQTKNLVIAISSFIGAVGRLRRFKTGFLCVALVVLEFTL